MSNWYLCAKCAHNPKAPWVGGVVDCEVLGLTRAKVMVDHGHSNGRRPYDDVHDVCERFEMRHEKPVAAETLDELRERVADVGAGTTPSYHCTESAEEARAVIDRCASELGIREMDA